MDLDKLLQWPGSRSPSEVMASFSETAFLGLEVEEIPGNKGFLFSSQVLMGSLSWSFWRCLTKSRISSAAASDGNRAGVLGDREGPREAGMGSHDALARLAGEESRISSTVHSLCSLMSEGGDAAFILQLPSLHVFNCKSFFSRWYRLKKEICHLRIVRTKTRILSSGSCLCVHLSSRYDFSCTTAGIYPACIGTRAVS